MFKKSLNIAEKIFTVCDHAVEQESQEGGPALLSASTLVLLTEGAVSQEGHQSLSCPQERLHSEPAEPLQPLKATVGSHPWKGKKLGDCFGSSVTLCSHLGQAAELGEHPSAPCSSPEQPGWFCGQQIFPSTSPRQPGVVPALLLHSVMIHCSLPGVGW